jgi:hypothetical protein
VAIAGTAAVSDTEPDRTRTDSAAPARPSALMIRVAIESALRQDIE